MFLPVYAAQQQYSAAAPQHYSAPQQQFSATECYRSASAEPTDYRTQMMPTQQQSSPLRTQSQPSSDPTGVVKFENTRQNRMRPVDFQPNGSFQVLKETGKLVSNGGEFDPAYRGRDKAEANAGYVPGYTGFVRGGQHISGRTYGEATRRALKQDYREIVCASPIPSSPQSNRKIQHRVLDDTFVTNTFGTKEYHIPGYTGHCPGVRNTYSKSYGSATAQELSSSTLRSGTQPNDGFARTAIPRQMLHIDSAPLPGGLKTNNPPDMYIPAHLRYLKFFPM